MCIVLLIGTGLGDSGNQGEGHTQVKDHGRSIVSGGQFDEYIMSTSFNSVVVINARLRHVKCEWAG
jgi:hypothetical protein